MHHFQRLLICLALSVSCAAVATAEASPQHPLFDHIDANHDGVISLAEWLSFRSEIREHQRETQVPAGTATTMAGLNQRHLQRSPPAQEPAGVVGARTVRTGAPGAEERHPLFDRIDSDHNGVITLSEWSAFRSAHAREDHHPRTAPAAGITPPAAP